MSNQIVLGYSNLGPKYSTGLRVQYWTLKYSSGSELDFKSELNETYLVTYTHLHIHMYTHMHTYMYTYTYIHIYLYLPSPMSLHPTHPTMVFITID